MAEIREIPGPEAWTGFEEDYGGKRLRAFWLGKSLGEMATQFSGGQSIQRADELLHMPRSAFQFYVFSHAQYLLSDKSVRDSEAASVFLGLLAAREKRDPGSVAQVYEQLLPAISFVAASQPRFDADKSHYGDFGERAAEVARLCRRDPDELTGENQMLDPTDDA